MKKIFVLGSVLALAACGISKEQIAQHDADFAGCERIATTDTHLVYKCPANMEMIANVKAQEPDALFQNGRGIEGWPEVANADTESVLVEVVHGKFGKIEKCVEDFHYRTIVKPVNTETKEFYAVMTCKTVAEEKPAEEVAK